MSAMSNALENELINYYFRNQSQAIAPVAQLYVALSTASVSESATGASMTECTGTSYARQAVTFAAPSNGATSNTGDLTWTAGAADWGTLTSVYVVDSSSGAGNVLVGADLSSTATLGSGDSLTIATGDLDVTMA